MVSTHLPNYSVRTGVHWQASGLAPEAVDRHDLFVVLLEKIREVDCLGRIEVRPVERTELLDGLG